MNREAKGVHERTAGSPWHAAFLKKKVLVSGSSPMNQAITRVMHKNLCLVCCSTRYAGVFAKYEITGEPKILPFLFVVIKHTEHLTGHRFLCST